MIILVTGGTRGIGYATCEYLLKKGHVVIVNYLNSDEIAIKMQKSGFDIFKADVSNAFEVQKMFDYIYKKYNRLDVLINNAGICLPQKLLIDTSNEEFDKVFNVNVKGVYNTSKTAISKMLSSGGKIINISSVFALSGGSCESIYSASKGAISSFSRALASEMEFSSIAIVEVVLGLIDTDMNKHLTKEEKLAFIKGASLKKIYTPSDVAKRLYAIILKQNEQVNGKQFKIGVGKV